jgi:three-Cys-motif partner protein
MKKPRLLEFDEIGYWSEVKLSILEEYAKPYNQILHSKKLTTVYIDAFAGAGHHISKGNGEIIKGSPMRALTVQPPFDMLHFVDMNDPRTKN